ncbi:MAG: hypothetical protein U9Q78_06265 [Chloroflexota bacterium]|nr:hypothetical protein [Chloroflexota bacterium]
MPEGQGWVRANDDAALYVTNTIGGDYQQASKPAKELLREQSPTF